MSFQDRTARERPWVIIFILLSLLAHLLFVLAIILITHYLPVPKPKPARELATTSISFVEPPPPAPRVPPPPPPPHRRPFMLTSPDPLAPKKETLVESDNDSRMRSHSKVARDPDSLAPDVDVKQPHPANLHNAPNAPSKEKPQVASKSSPGQTQQAKAAPPAPQPAQTQPETATAEKPSLHPQPASKVSEDNPSKTNAPHPQKQVLDANGLPVLPPLSAPTIAPRTMQAKATPASSLPEIAQSVKGAVGTHGDDSPEAMATELGRYKAKVYRTVGSLWYHKVDLQQQVLPVGVVHIQFTIHKDGTVDTKVLEGNESNLQLLLSLSINSIRESAPFDPFTDSMIKEVGDSYTDDFSFSIYGSGDGE